MDPLRAWFELGGIVLALIAIITGIYKVSVPIIAMKMQMVMLQEQLYDVRQRLQRIEHHIAPTA